MYVIVGGMLVGVRGGLGIVRAECSGLCTALDGGVRCVICAIEWRAIV